MDEARDMNLIFFDMEGPLSIQDNACEMMKVFPHGGQIFDVVKRYDRLLSLEGRDDYDPGDGLVRIVPFLVHHGVTADDMLALAERAVIVDGAEELIAGLDGWEVFCVTASYEQYAARIVQRVGIDLERLACTRFPIGRCYELMSVADHALVGDVEREILFVRDSLVAEHLGVVVERFRDEVDRRGTFRYGVEELRRSGRSLRKLTDTMVSADEGPFAENDLMDPLFVPQSIAGSALKLAESVATWPLRQSTLGAWYQKLRGTAP